MTTAGGRQNIKAVAIIPALNEELAIGTVVILTKLHVDQVIVIDDGSIDKTPIIAKSAGAHVITLSKNQGKASAIFCGIEYARSCDAEVLIMIDGDGQHNPDEIPLLINKILQKKVDMVVGSRQIGDRHSHSRSSIPLYRSFGQRTLDIATNFGSSYKSTDSQSGFRALSKRAIENMNFQSEGYNIESDMNHHFARLGFSIVEVPISVRYDVPNKHKKNPLSHGMEIIGHLIGIIGYKRPLLSFGLPGGICIISGLIAAFMTFTQYYENAHFPYMLAMISGFFIFMGILLVIGGLILNAMQIVGKSEKVVNSL